uniref:Uncharacterized mitochondrial protein AtMg00810-like n=1 Tax=Tanacetum cinerariifolium TaxID=118510 RepID=A0A6L2P1V0_TANCI|nr:uncharacterized mitochondrial protein AtMg00810-like [Tanacetum cinerariifolium]
MSMIGSFMYLTSSRPDIMFAVCACARFQVTLKVSHLQAVKRIFRYLKGKPHLGLWYLKDSLFNLVAYSDSDYAGASLDRNSTTRGCQFLVERKIEVTKDMVPPTNNGSTKDVQPSVVQVETQIPNSEPVEAPYQVDEQDGIKVTAVGLKLLLSGIFLLLMVRNVDSPSKFLMSGYSFVDGMLVQKQVQAVEDAAEDEDDDTEEVGEEERIQIFMIKEIKEGGKIAKLNADEDVTLVDAEEDMNVDVQGRLVESQAKVYHLDLQHAEKVLSMQDTDEAELVEVEEVIEVVIIAKLMTENPNLSKRQAQIEQDEAFARQLKAELNANISWDDVMDQVKRREKQDNTIIIYQALKIKPMTEAQARKNMMMYLKNMAVFKMDFFKEKREKEIEEEGSKRKVNDDDDDDLFTEATLLASKIILLVEKKYPLIHFTLEQMLNNVRLEVEEESEMSLELLRLPGDDANKHLDKLLHVIQNIKVNGVTDDALHLYLFPHSLTHHATAWFDRLPRNSITTFEQMAKMFLGKYFPPSMVTKLRNERFDDSLFEAWRPEECYDLIENMTGHHNDWDTSIQRNESSSSITSSFDLEIVALKAKMAKINKNLMKVL